MKLFWTLAMLPLTTSLPEPVQAAPEPAWVVDPATPGPDVPPVGQSLFDQITLDRAGRRQIPYPFDRLIARIESAAGCSSSRPCTRAVLIPLGRSLQRAAASPDFYRHPRVVTGVVADGTGAMLRDRLYLGFQDRAGVIEVISYNEAAGRFEFQIVRNYGADAVPQVTHARRALCVACHQNHGPIFSQAVWLETNANPEIATRLEREATGFFGIPARATTDVAQAIDDATDRATRLALVQRLWREGCGHDEQGARCRRSALVAALQFALTGRRAYITSDEFRAKVTAVLGARARDKWPRGLALPDADIANRNPLNVNAAMRGTAQVDISPLFDPLVPRPPLEIVPTDGEQLADRLVRGMADAWSAHNVAALSKTMERRGRHLHARRIELPCRMNGTAMNELFECAAPSGLGLRGTLSREGGEIEEIAIGQRPLRHLRIDSLRRTSDVSRRTASFRVADDYRRARLADGNLIERIVMEWQPAQGRPAEGVATIETRGDFALAQRAAESVEWGDGPLRSSMLEEIAARIREDLPAAIPESPKTVASVDAVPAVAHAAALPFEGPCGACHHTSDATPPNFLAGDAQHVEAAIKSCAPRIYVRMAMRDLPPSQRAKSPMPPERYPALADAHDADRRTLVELRAAVESLLVQEHGRRPSLDDLLRHGYESLPACLPGS